MSGPTEINTTATEADTIIQNANSAGVQFIETLAIADVPFLGYPVIKTIFGFILGWLDGYISKAEQTGVTFVIIDAQVGAEETALSKALAAIAAAQKSGDANALKLAIQAYADAQSALLHDDGSATPQ